MKSINSKSIEIRPVSMIIISTQNRWKDGFSFLHLIVNDDKRRLSVRSFSNFHAYDVMMICRVSDHAEKLISSDENIPNVKPSLKEF